jgi:ribosomal protein S18 acetylase RimI-like enzyme
MKPLDGSEALALDNPGWAALTGPQARFAETRGHAVRYRTDVVPLSAVGDWADERAWADLADLAAPDGVVTLAGVGLRLPSGWQVTGGGEGLQMIGDSLAAADDAEAVILTAADVPQMLDLIGRTQPGPFLPRTVELGTYLGIRRDGALVAMAGERMRTPGWTEISAVCTDEAYRGQGLAHRLVNAVAAGIQRRGDRSFLHVSATNTGAVHLYESLGFKHRTHLTFAVAKVPGSAA